MMIIIVIALMIGGISLVFDTAKNKKLMIIGKIGIVMSIIVLYMIAVISIGDKEAMIPTIEVYRGNTTLQITYQDSIPIDSVVVYKNK